MVRAVFVGGPVDGRCQSIPFAAPIWHVPLSPAFSHVAMVYDAVLQAPDAFPVERYRRVALHPLPTDVAVYVHTSIPDDEVLLALVAGYRMPITRDDPGAGVR